MKKILVTAALPYINNVPHMGHIVGSHLPADIFHRYCLQKGYDSTFVGGSDEYGTPSVIAASENKMDTKDFVDKLHVIHKKIYQKLNISYDNYSRTTSNKHTEVVQNFFKSIDKKYISKSKIEMYFSAEDNMFLPDRFIKGTCPRCFYKDANGDQCEKCGYVLATALELLDPRSKISGAIPIIKETEHIYLNLDILSSDVNEWLESKKNILKTNVYSEGKKWINEGLKKRSISRDMSWGVKIPNENKVFYVWFDAPIGYITFCEELSKNSWKDDTEIYHFLGKDNIPFHIIFWPAMLLASKKFNMPHYVAGYNFLNYQGEKFSKSKNIGVFCHNLLESDLDMDMLRFYLTSIIPESKDSDFNWQNFKNVTNSELIGNLSNFFNRTLSMVWKNFNGDLSFNGDFLPEDNIVLNALKDYPEIVDKMLEKLEIRAAQKKILELSSIGNKYIDSQEPWKLSKNNDKENLSRVMVLCLNLCKTLTILVAPIMPTKMIDFWNNQLNIEGSPLEKYQFSFLRVFKTQQPQVLFTRIDDKNLENLEKYFSKSFDLKSL